MADTNYKEKYSVAVIGFGGMGSWHAMLIAGQVRGGLQTMELAGVYDIDEAKQQEARDKGMHTYGSFEEVLADKKVDIVLCATPNDCHKDITIRSLRADKHVICEKPVAMDSGELAEMIAVANETGKLFTVHQNRRWDEDFITMKYIYDSGDVGQVFEVQSRVHGSRGIPGDWRGKKIHGGGMMFDWGVHIIDQILFMIPEKVVSVFCTITNITNDEVDDGFHLVLKFESGRYALLEVCTCNYIGLPRWYMVGTDGAAIIKDFECNGKIVSIIDKTKNDAKPVVTAAGLTKTMAPRDDETIKEYPLPEIKLDEREFYDNVAMTISGKETPLITHNQLMRVFKLMETALESAETGKALKFE